MKENLQIDIKREVMGAQNATFLFVAILRKVTALTEINYHPWSSKESSVSRVQKQKLIVKSPNGKNLNTAEVQISPFYRLDVLISIRKTYIRTYSGKELLLH
jgi:hypothetical protein